MKTIEDIKAQANMETTQGGVLVAEVERGRRVIERERAENFGSEQQRIDAIVWRSVVPERR